MLRFLLVFLVALVVLAVLLVAGRATVRWYRQRQLRRLALARLREPP